MKVCPRYISGLLLTLCIAGIPLLTSAQQVLSSDRPGVADMLEAVTPSVVNISVSGTTTLQLNPLLEDPLFRRFFEFPDQIQPQTRETRSVGSGVIIDAGKGYVLTNHHVIDNAEKIEITLHDKRRLPAKLIGSDAGTDIALLQVDADNLVAIPESDSSTVRVGDFVAAIGNPFGLGQTVTTGIVSALGRSGISREGYEDFIQTDASINPGNSGGALIDYNGRLIGINSAIIAPAGGNVGIGFAVPINMARSIIDQLLEFGEIRRGALGILVQDLTPDVAEAMDLDVTQGAVVSRVDEDSAAAKAGIEAGDVIVAVDDKTITSSSDLRNTIGLMRAGSKVQIKLIRERRQRTVSAEIGRASAQNVAGRLAQDSTVLQGAELSGIPRSHPSYGKVSGVLVTTVQQGSRAWENGLRPDDIITAVNQTVVTSPAKVEEEVAASKGAVAMSVLRDDSKVFLIMR
jgi:serine protease DegQ